jgi:hypothetical protein
MDFPLASGPYTYRTLRLADPMQNGWDVFALQTTLPAITADGWFGKQTDGALRKAQTSLSLQSDGLAGPLTQRALVLDAAAKTSANAGVQFLRVKGQLEHESGYLVGNHTAPYSNGSRDLGVAQINSSKDADKQPPFTVGHAIGALCSRIIENHSRYASRVSDKRAWDLAQGSWNAPAWTDAIAFGKPISDEHRQQIEAYIAAVSIYV